MGHQRHYNILYDNAKDMIRRGIFGELHYIRAQWHRGNLPGNDSWQLPLPPAQGKATTRWPSELVKGLADIGEANWPRPAARHRPWRRGRGSSGRSPDARSGRRWSRTPAENSATRSPQIKDARGQSGLRGARHRGVDPLAALGPHRRRPDGRAGQPPVGRGEHLHRARRTAARWSIRIRSNVVAAANRPLFPADRDVRTTSSA